MNTSENKTIVAFHIGRGGCFNNQGHKSFIGQKNINDLMNIQSDHLFYYNRDSKGRFCKPYYADLNGKRLITEKEAATGCGCLDWDGEYDTDYCQYLSECNEQELKLIANSDEWNAIQLVQEFFNNEYSIDWLKFNREYIMLIEDHFNSVVRIEEYIS